MQQLGLGDFFHLSAGEAGREFDVFHQQIQLLGGASLQFVEEEVQAAFVAGSLGEAYARLGLGLVGAAQLFFHEDGFFVEQGLDDGEDVLDAAVLLELRDALLRFGGEEVEYLLFFLRQADVGLEIGVVLHDRFAFQLQAGGQCGFVDVALGAEVIIGQPLPELELARQQYGAGIEQRGDFFYFVLRRGEVVHVAHNGGVVLLPSERYYHATTRLHVVCPFVGQGVGEAAVQGQRQYDIHKLFHRGGKDKGKRGENEGMWGVFFVGCGG